MVDSFICTKSLFNPNFFNHLHEMVNSSIIPGGRIAEQTVPLRWVTLAADINDHHPERFVCFIFLIFLFFLFVYLLFWLLLLFRGETLTIISKEELAGNWNRVTFTFTTLSTFGSKVESSFWSICRRLWCIRFQLKISLHWKDLKHLSFKSGVNNGSWKRVCRENWGVVIKITRT